MKKIFNILMIAAVALGAVACQNDIDDNLSPEQNGESLSIEVEISDATKVALGDFVEDKGYKLDFEDGDQLLVTTAWGGDTANAENNFWFTYSSETGLFTCTTTGVSAIKGQERSVFHLATHPEMGLVGGVLCDSEAGLNGVKMVGYTSALGEEKITLDVYPILKYTSESPVTFTANKSIFGAIKSWGIGQYAEYTFPAGTNVYVPIYESGEITLSATIKGEVVKEATKLTFATNKIYNLGELIPEPVIADVANIEIDGDFSDWEAVTTNVATLAAGATSYTAVKTLKAYATSTHFYFYVEYDATDVENMHINMDLDLNSATGTQQAWMWSNKSNFRLQVSPYSYNDDHSTQTISESPYWSRKYWTTDWVTDSEVTVDDCTIVKLGNGNHAIEFSIPRSTNINTSITGESVGIGYYMDKGSYGSWAIPGYLPQNGSMLVIPVPAAE